MCGSCSQVFSDPQVGISRTFWKAGQCQGCTLHQEAAGRRRGRGAVACVDPQQQDSRKVHAVTKTEEQRHHTELSPEGEQHSDFGKNEAERCHRHIFKEGKHTV